MKKISITKAMIILFIVAAFGVAAISVMANKNKELFEYTTKILQRQDLTQTVSETGLIKTAESYDLSFQQNGKIDKIYTDIGQIVQKDQLLAELDHEDLDIKLKQAQASLDIASANLRKLQSGATREDIAIYQAGYNRAKTAYDSSVNELAKYKTTLNENTTQAQKTLNDLEDKGIYTVTTQEQAVDSAFSNLENTKTTYQRSINNSISTSLSNAEAKASSMSNALDQVNSILTDDDIDDYLSVKNKTYLADSERAYDGAILLLSEVKTNIQTIKEGPKADSVSDLLTEVLNTLNTTYLSLTNCFSALENSVTSSSFTKTQLDSLKAIINTQIGIISSSIISIQASDQGLDSAILSYNTNVDAATNNLSQAQAGLDNALIGAKNKLANVINGGEQQLVSLQGKIDSANKSLLVSQAELNKIKSPARSEDINLYQAQYRQAESQLNSIDNQIEKSKLISPVVGTISKLNFEIGEQYTIGKPMVTLISDAQYKIEVDISESDITKLKIGDKVSITFDAFRSDIKFSGTVSFIEPAATVIQEVVYYKVTIIFDQKNDHIDLVKPGMTANVEITTNYKEDILVIPGRAIIDKDQDGKFVKTYNNNIIKEKKVQVGIIGDGGLVEILSGLSEGDKVVTFTKKK